MMELYDSYSLIGLEQLQAQVDKVCGNSAKYHRCGVLPPSFLIDLESGNGQTTVAEYVADQYDINQVRTFHGLDAYLEFRLDGTSLQMNQIFGEITAAAVYTNQFEGIIALDAAALTPHVQDDYMKEIMKKLGKLSETATFLIFLPDNGKKNTLQLKEMLKGAIRGLVEIPTEPYTGQQLGLICERMLEERGVQLNPTQELHQAVEALVAETGCKRAVEVINAADRIMEAVDFSGFRPSLNAEGVKALLPAPNMETAGGRSDV